MSWVTRATLNLRSKNQPPASKTKLNNFSVTYFFLLGGLSPGLDGQVKIWTTPRSGINLIKLSWTLQVHVQYLGAFRGRVSRYLHRQSGRFHDSEKRIPWYQEEFCLFNKSIKSSDNSINKLFVNFPFLQRTYPKLDLSGLEDPKISNPFSHQPPLKYTTLPYSYSHVNKLSLSPQYVIIDSYSEGHAAEIPQGGFQSCQASSKLQQLQWCHQTCQRGVIMQWKSRFM